MAFASDGHAFVEACPSSTPFSCGGLWLWLGVGVGVGVGVAL